MPKLPLIVARYNRDAEGCRIDKTREVVAMFARIDDAEWACRNMQQYRRDRNTMLCVEQGGRTVYSVD